MVQGYDKESRQGITKRPKKEGNQKSRKVNTVSCYESQNKDFQGVDVVEYFREVHLHPK